MTKKNKNEVDKAVDKEKQSYPPQRKVETINVFEQDIVYKLDSLV